MFDVTVGVLEISHKIAGHNVGTSYGSHKLNVYFELYFGGLY